MSSPSRRRAILVAGWARGRPADRILLAVLSGLVAIGVIVVLREASSFAGRSELRSLELSRLTLLGSSLTTLAAVLLPAIAPAVGRRMGTPTAQHVILAAALVLMLFVLPVPALVGQVWSANGLAGNGLLSGTRGPVVGDTAWALSEQLALLGGILLTALILRWGQRHLGGVRTLPSPLLAAGWQDRPPAHGSAAPVPTGIRCRAGRPHGPDRLSARPVPVPDGSRRGDPAPARNRKPIPPRSESGIRPRRPRVAGGLRHS